MRTFFCDVRNFFQTFVTFRVGKKFLTPLIIFFLLNPVGPKESFGPLGLFFRSACFNKAFAFLNADSSLRIGMTRCL